MSLSPECRPERFADRRNVLAVPDRSGGLTGVEGVSLKRWSAYRCHAVRVHLRLETRQRLRHPLGPPAFTLLLLYGMNA